MNNDIYKGVPPEQARASQMKGAWLEDPYTVYLRNKEQALKEQALQLLLGKCADSVDPAIVRSYSNYLMHQRRIELLSKGDT